MPNVIVGIFFTSRLVSDVIDAIEFLYVVLHRLLLCFGTALYSVCNIYRSFPQTQVARLNDMELVLGYVLLLLLGLGYELLCWRH